MVRRRHWKHGGRRLPLGVGNPATIQIIQELEEAHFFVWDRAGRVEQIIGNVLLSSSGQNNELTCT